MAGDGNGDSSQAAPAGSGAYRGLPPNAPRWRTRWRTWPRFFPRPAPHAAVMAAQSARADHGHRRTRAPPPAAIAAHAVDCPLQSLRKDARANDPAAVRWCRRRRERGGGALPLWRALTRVPVPWPRGNERATTSAELPVLPSPRSCRTHSRTTRAASPVSIASSCRETHEKGLSARNRRTPLRRPQGL